MFRRSWRPRRRAHPRAAALVSVVLLAAGLGACGANGSGDTVKRDQLIVATTTSLQDSGLIDDVVLPLYEKVAPGVTVKVLAVGSGEAMAMGQRGEADVLLVHSPADEVAFMESGDGTLRLPFATNSFEIVGPKGDPAGVRRAGSAADAFTAIARRGATFATRGDESGTNKKELEIWEAAAVPPAGDWYVSTGQGMGETLRIASEKQGYTMTDSATYLSLKDSLDLVSLFTGSADLKNAYSVVIVNQDKFPTVNSPAAELMAQALVGAEGQKDIGAYGVDTYGKRFFTPYADALGSDAYSAP